MRIVQRFPLIACTIAAAFCFSASGVAHAEKRVALVVGNSGYVNVPRLTNPVNDARLIADTLRALGFTLVGGGAQLDLSKSSFEEALQKFSNELTGADVALFYYAGHGVQVRNTNYLVPIGANPIREGDVDLQMLDSNVVLRQMESAGTKLNLVILDACRNNPFGGRGLRASDSGLAQMHAPEGTLISFATQPNSVALDGSDGNSPYTKALAQTLRKPGLDIFRTFNEVGLAVAAATRGNQQPWVSASPIKGEFYFAGATTAEPKAGKSAAAVVQTPSQDEPAAHASVSPVPAETPRPLAFLVPRSFQQPSFDCERTNEPLENLICADGELAEWDGRMGQVYKSKLRDRGNRNNLLREQRDWIVRRSEECGVPKRASVSELTPLKPCVLQMIKERFNELVAR